MNTQLTGPRTSLRAFQPTDAPAVWVAIAESRTSLTRWIPDVGRRGTLAMVRSGLEQLATSRARRERLVYGIWEHDGQRFLGEIGLHDIDWEQQQAAIGYWLRVSARGQGLIDEALDVLQTYALRVLGLEHLEAHIASDNQPSRRVAERHGYLLTGARQADPQWDGEADTVLIYTLRLGQSAAA